MRRLAVAAGLAAALATPAWASNTATSRAYTTDWTCSNGRSVLINAHPLRPREEAWLTYAGNRVELKLAASPAGTRFASKDGLVVWRTVGNEATLEFAGLLERPLTCSLKNAPKN